MTLKIKLRILYFCLAIKNDHNEFLSTIRMIVNIIEMTLLVNKDLIVILGMIKY